MATNEAMRGLLADRVERVHLGAEHVAGVLERVASNIRYEVRRARGGHQPGGGVVPEHYLVDVVVSAVMGMGPDLRLDTLVERLMAAAESRALIASEERMVAQSAKGEAR